MIDTLLCVLQIVGDYTELSTFCQSQDSNSLAFVMVSRSLVSHGRLLRNSNHE